MKTTRKRKPFAIITDMDDVLVDFSSFIIFLHNKEYGTCLSKSDIKNWDYSSLDMEDVRGNKVTGEQLISTYKKWESNGLYSALPIISEAKFALKIMKELGYVIIIITAREDQFKKATMLNLIKHNIIFDEIYFEHDKVKKIKELKKQYNIKLFADDKLSTILDVHENCGIKNVCLINMSHNKEAEIDSEIKRIDTLFEGVRFLK